MIKADLLNQRMREVGESITRYLSNNSERAVSPSQTPEKLRELMNFSFTEKGEGWDEISVFIDSYLNNSVRTYDPRFMNQLWSGFSEESLLSEMVTAASNTSMYTYEVAPAAILVERAIIDKLLSMVGFEQGEGIFTTGGTGSNLSALLAARNRAKERVAENGLTHNKNFCFVSDVSHYSFAKAMNVTGLGINQLIKVKTNDKGEMIVAELEREIEKVISFGGNPLFIAATSGTTVQGAFDPIDEIAPIARKYEAWLHVDGAWGGSVLYHQEHKNLLKGLELADSFSWDGHKMLGLSLICSVLLVKKRGSLKTSHQHGNGDSYIFREEHEDSNLDSGPFSIQCGRKADALKWFLHWKKKGDLGLHDQIDHLFNLGKEAVRIIEESSDLHMACERSSVNVCFYYWPSSFDTVTDEIVDFNVRLRDSLLRKGEFLFNYGDVNGKLSLRLIFANEELSFEGVRDIFECIRKEAKEISK